MTAHNGKGLIGYEGIVGHFHLDVNAAIGEAVANEALNEHLPFFSGPPPFRV